MKLFTEEQVNKIALQVKDNGYYNHLEITPIELPSDEEIEYKGDEFSDRASYSECFKEGAEWVIEQIKQQDK